MTLNFRVDRLIPKIAVFRSGPMSFIISVDSNGAEIGSIWFVLGANATGSDLGLTMLLS